MSEQAEEMRVDPARAKVLVENLEQVVKRVDAVRGTRQVRLIAVSKLKPATDILALHESQKHHDFGENYSDELTKKANLLPRSIRWHMIGGLQTNKCKPLASEVPNLWCVSSVDTAKKANELEKGRKSLAEKESLTEKLRVLVQVNTSGEESKSGVEPKDASELCKHVRDQCPSLQLAGLMTIGAIARSQEASSAEALNEDFVTLRETRDKVVGELGIEKEELKLSMGMSQDFEAAISAGSDEVRVGTTIFGDRPAKKDAKIL
ncbi:Putative pyridoxal phosphate homeostasis protein [Septoria linicola]|uniref:Pyridoxal phosphate homeostasis protein n=1 Tax=Septoria linicola TaxID=215465 RepID=A0A9Q9AUZ4_9PEZI|nr:putative pyridoxal phosphate homeostasis protein [Septoria linicola]USW55625.1 Putative pyridoxal phosphate homeostasis protein [Septoria linicola]